MKLTTKQGKRLLLSLFILLITFPSFNLVSSPGLDSSYTWGLNYLFVTDFQTLTQLVYPIGVLGFLKMPLPIGPNFIFALVFYSIIKTSFVYLLLSLEFGKTNSTKILSLILIILAALHSGFDITIIALCALLGMRFLSTHNLAPLVLFSALAYLGFNIKTSIGISCFSVLFMTAVLFFYTTKKWKLLLLPAAVSVFTLATVGLLIFGNFSDIYLHFIHAFKISSGYSSSLSLHPNNNWWVLSGFLILLLLFPIVFKSKKNTQLFLLFLPSFFMMWKHAMVREDASHNGILFAFTLVFFIIVIGVNISNKGKILLYGGFTLFLFYTNMKTIEGFSGISPSLEGHKNVNNLFHYSEYILEQNEVTKINLEPLLLSPQVTEIIGDNTIDFYPWEHNYAQANNLNWSPRKTIEIGASSSQWTSSLASKNYEGNNAPEFILWHYYPDNYEGNIGSFDNRLLLNDEPLVLMNILQNYQSVYKDDKISLFQKNNNPRKIEQQSDKKTTGIYDQWIEAPEAIGLVQCKVNIRNSFFQKTITFLYKDDLYEIDYKLKDGRVFTYRFLPNTAVNGLWISPFFNEMNSPNLESSTSHFRIRKVHYSLGPNNFDYQFVHSKLYSHSTHQEILVFDKKSNSPSSQIFNTKTDFESPIESQWVELSNQGHESQQSNQVTTNNYSFTYKFGLDSLWKLADSGINTMQIQVLAATKFDGTTADLIIETKNTQGDFWELTQVLNRNKWQHFYTPRTISRSLHSQGELLIYFWNKDKKDLFIDDFEIRFVTK